MIKFECPISNTVALRAIADALNIIASGKYTSTQTTTITESMGDVSITKQTTAPFTVSVGEATNNAIDGEAADANGSIEIDPAGVGFGDTETPPLTETETPPLTQTEATPSDGVGADGIPWDIRIHARTKSLDAKGSYNLMRHPKKVHPDKAEWLTYVEAVKIELRAGMGATTTASTPPLTETPATTDDELLVVRKNGVVQETPPLTETPALQETPATTETPAVTGGKSFADVMKLMTANRPKIVLQDVIKICKEFGVDSVMEIKGQDPEIIEAIYQSMLDHLNG